MFCQTNTLFFSLRGIEKVFAYMYNSLSGMGKSIVIITALSSHTPVKVSAIPTGKHALRTAERVRF